MSIIGNAGASSAAQDVKNFVEQRLKALPEESGEAKTELEAVKKKCEEIIRAAKDGYY